jgi:hypothetical protein
VPRRPRAASFREALAAHSRLHDLISYEAINTVNMMKVRVPPSTQQKAKDTTMKKSVLIAAAALLALGASGAYAQSPEHTTHHRWSHARERMAPYAHSMAFAPGGYRVFPGAVGDEAGNDANSMSGPNSANANAEGRTGD